MSEIPQKIVNAMGTGAIVTGLAAIPVLVVYARDVARDEEERARIRRLQWCKDDSDRLRVELNEARRKLQDQAPWVADDIYERLALVSRYIFQFLPPDQQEWVKTKLLSEDPDFLETFFNSNSALSVTIPYEITTEARRAVLRRIIDKMMLKSGTTIKSDIEKVSPGTKENPGFVTGTVFVNDKKTNPAIWFRASFNIRELTLYYGNVEIEKNGDWNEIVDKIKELLAMQQANRELLDELVRYKQALRR